MLKRSSTWVRPMLVLTAGWAGLDWERDMALLRRTAAAPTVDPLSTVREGISNGRATACE